jgi:serine/threonine protein phosphatase 1
MLDHGLGPTIAAYGGDLQQGQNAARDGAVSITRWTNGLRMAQNGTPGHANLMTALRRAAFTTDGQLLFVNAGLDPSRPLTAQSDSLWWGGSSFLDLAEPYAGFVRVIRGYDRHHGGVQQTKYAVSLDRGAGFGGKLVAGCFDPAGALLDTLEV